MSSTDRLAWRLMKTAGVAGETVAPNTRESLMRPREQVRIPHPPLSHEVEATFPQMFPGISPVTLAVPGSCGRRLPQSLLQEVRVSHSPAHRDSLKCPVIKGWHLVPSPVLGKVSKQRDTSCWCRGLLTLLKSMSLLWSDFRPH